MGSIGNRIGSAGSADRMGGALGSRTMDAVHAPADRGECRPVSQQGNGGIHQRLAQRLGETAGVGGQAETRGGERRGGDYRGRREAGAASMKNPCIAEIVFVFVMMMMTI